MRTRKGEVLTFQQKASRPVLSREQCRYLYDQAEKNIKVATEFELNLPDADINTKADNNEVCINSKRPASKCFKDCSNLETCITERHPTFCLTRSTGKLWGSGEKFTCPAKDAQDWGACQKCEGWYLNCRGEQCAAFVSYCAVCPSFERSTKVLGLAENLDIRKDARVVREEMKMVLQPTEDVGKVGPSGVLTVKEDGSLINNGGIEIPTVGRRPQWQSFYSMHRNILDKLHTYGAYSNERCGQHFHVLLSYLPNGGDHNTTEVEHPIPEIVVANFHQLFRRYELAWFWLTSAGDRPESLTRWSKFRLPILRYSAIQRKADAVYQEMKAAPNSHSGKYMSVNYHYSRFNVDGSARIFHVENRIPDGCMSAAAISSWAMLNAAFVLKAVKLSQYGVLNAGTTEYLAKVKEVLPCLVNGQEREYGQHRKADTSKIGPHIPWLVENAQEMVELMKPELSKMGSAYSILMALAELPISLRRVRGDSWVQIESDLYPTREQKEETPIEREISELIDLAIITGCPNLEQWVSETSDYMGNSSEVVREVVYGMLQNKEFKWDDNIGTVVLG